jgi:hypothetical protein
MNARKRVVMAVVTIVGAARIEVAAASSIALDGYLDFKKGSYFIIDGQRVEITGKTKVEAGKWKPLEVPLGYRIKAQASRGADGRLVASRIQGSKNGIEYMEKDVISGTNAAEKSWVQAKKVAQAAAGGKQNEIGTLIETGPQVDRCRKIVDRLLPPALWTRFAQKYGDQDKVTNFFFGDHSLSAKRAKNLQAEISHNYADPGKDPPSRSVK